MDGLGGSVGPPFDGHSVVYPLELYLFDLRDGLIITTRQKHK
jgi:hypothetical protein